jgi:hypothetical protein
VLDPQAKEAFGRGVLLANVIELIERLDAIGDVSTQIHAAKKILPKLRSLRTTRTPDFLTTLKKRRDSLAEVTALLHKLGNLGELKKQIEVLEDVRAELYQPRDIDVALPQLFGLGEKLDALDKLIKHLKAWEKW